MRERHVTDTDVDDALSTRRARHEEHSTRPGSYWAQIEHQNMWVLYRPLHDGDDFVITVTPRP